MKTNQQQHILHDQQEQKACESQEKLKQVLSESAVLATLEPDGEPLINKKLKSERGNGNNVKDSSSNDALSQQNEANKIFGSQHTNSIDDMLISHGRRKLIKSKEGTNQEHIISTRSLSRARNRASSRHSSKSSKSLTENMEGKALGLVGSPNQAQQQLQRALESVASSDMEVPFYMTTKAEDQTHPTGREVGVIEEQEVEETGGDEVGLSSRQFRNSALDRNTSLKSSAQRNDSLQQQSQLSQRLQQQQSVEKLPAPQVTSPPPAPKQVITFDMIQSLQNSKQAANLINKMNENSDDELDSERWRQKRLEPATWKSGDPFSPPPQAVEEQKPLTASWERSIKDTSSSFVGDLFSKFNFGVGLGFGSKLPDAQKAPSVGQTGYNKKVTLIVRKKSSEKLAKVESEDSFEDMVEKSIEDKVKPQVEEENKGGDKPLSQSWEKSIQMASSSFVEDLFAKFAINRAMADEFKALGVVKTTEQKSGYNKRVTLVINKAQSLISDKTELIESAVFDGQKSIMEEGYPIRIQVTSASNLGEEIQPIVIQETFINSDSMANIAQVSSHTSPLNLGKIVKQESLIINRGDQSYGKQMSTQTMNVIVSQSEIDTISADEQQMTALPGRTLAEKKFVLTTQPLIDIQAKTNMGSQSTTNIPGPESLDPNRFSEISQQINQGGKTFVSDTPKSIKVGKKQHTQQYEMSFNNGSNHKLKENSNFIDISFQGSHTALILHNTHSEMKMDLMTPTSQTDEMVGQSMNEGGADFDNYQEVAQRKHQLLQLLMQQVIEAEIRGASQALEKRTEQQILSITLERAEEQLVSELLESAIDSQKQEMYHSFLDGVVDQVQGKVVEKLIEEYTSVVLNVGSPETAASYVVKQLEEKLMSRMVDFLDQEQTIESERLKLASETIYLKQLLSQMDQFKDEINRDYESFLKKREVIYSKNTKAKKAKKEAKQAAANQQQTLEGVSSGLGAHSPLDVDFFEKCFFGKRLQIKDQIIFKIYAQELLEIIKDSFSKQIRKKYKQLLRLNAATGTITSHRARTRTKSRHRKRIRSPDGRSPLESPASARNAIQSDQRQPISERQSPRAMINNLKGGSSKHFKLPEGAIRMYTVDQRIIHHNPISINIIEQQNNNFQGTDQSIKNYYYQTVNLQGIEENTESSGNGKTMVPPPLRLASAATQPHSKQNSPSNRNMYHTIDSRVKTSGAKSKSPTIDIDSANQDNATYNYLNGRITNANSALMSSSAKKRQASSTMRKQGPLDMTKLLAGQKSPPRQQQVRIFHNLENQMKDILKNEKIFGKGINLNSINFTSIKKIKLKARNAQTAVQSGNNSPIRSNLKINQSNSNLYPVPQVQVIQAPKELPAVRNIAKYKFQTQKGKSQIISAEPASLGGMDSILNQGENPGRELGLTALDRQALQDYIYRHSHTMDQKLQQEGSKVSGLGLKLQSNLGTPQEGILNVKSSVGSIQFPSYFKDQDSDAYQNSQRPETSHMSSHPHELNPTLKVKSVPSKFRSLSTAKHAIDAAFIMKRNGSKSCKKNRSPFVTNEQANIAAQYGLNLKASTHYNNIKRPQSKGRYIFNDLRSVNSAALNNFMSQTGHLYNEQQQNSSQGVRTRILANANVSLQDNANSSVKNFEPHLSLNSDKYKMRNQIQSGTHHIQNNSMSMMNDSIRFQPSPHLNQTIVHVNDPLLQEHASSMGQGSSQGFGNPSSQQHYQNQHNFHNSGSVATTNKHSSLEQLQQQQQRRLSQPQVAQNFEMGKRGSQGSLLSAAVNMMSPTNSRELHNANFSSGIVGGTRQKEQSSFLDRQATREEDQIREGPAVSLSHDNRSNSQLSQQVSSPPKLTSLDRHSEGRGLVQQKHNSSFNNEEEKLQMQDMRRRNNTQLTNYQRIEQAVQQPVNPFAASKSRSDIPELNAEMHSSKQKIIPTENSYSDYSQNHRLNTQQQNQYLPNSSFMKRAEELSINSDRINKELNSMKQNSQQIESMIDQYSEIVNETINQPNIGHSTQNSNKVNTSNTRGGGGSSSLTERDNNPYQDTHQQSNFVRKQTTNRWQQQVNQLGKQGTKLFNIVMEAQTKKQYEDDFVEEEVEDLTV